MVLPSTTTRAEMASCGREPNQSLSGHGGSQSENRADNTRVAARVLSRPAFLQLGNVLFEKAFSGCAQTLRAGILARSANPRFLPKSPLSATHSHELDEPVHHVGGRLGLRDHIRPTSLWERWWRVMYGTRFALRIG